MTLLKSKQVIRVQKNEVNQALHLLASETKTNTNQSLLNGIETLIANKNKKETELLKLIDELNYEKKLVDDLISTQIDYKERFKEPPSILSSLTSDESTNKDIKNTKIISIGLSKTVRGNYDLKGSTYETSLTSNEYADDDEDIVVILDEK